jgi:hypothetical protein
VPGKYRAEQRYLAPVIEEAGSEEVMKHFPLPWAVACFCLSFAFAGSCLAQGREQGKDSKHAAATPSEEQGAAGQHDTGYIDPNEPLFTRGPLSKENVSLIGGMVGSVDRIHNRMKVKITGGRSVSVSFDERTLFFRDGQPVTYEKIQKGDRVYLDTVLSQQRVFARNVRVQSHTLSVEARGQIVAYDAGKAQMTMLDELSSEPVTMHVSGATSFKSATGSARITDLIPGALVAVSFSPAQGASAQAKEITVLARPGSMFVFAGSVTHIDLRAGVFSMANASDNKNYDISFDPARTPNLENLTIGSEVNVKATFSGKKYLANEVQISRAQAQAVER